MSAPCGLLMLFLANCAKFLLRCVIVAYLIIEFLFACLFDAPKCSSRQCEIPSDTKPTENSTIDSSAPISPSNEASNTDDNDTVPFGELPYGFQRRLISLCPVPTLIKMRQTGKQGYKATKSRFCCLDDLVIFYRSTKIRSYPQKYVTFDTVLNEQKIYIVKESLKLAIKSRDLRRVLPFLAKTYCQLTFSSTYTLPMVCKFLHEGITDVGMYGIPEVNQKHMANFLKTIHDSALARDILFVIKVTQASEQFAQQVASKVSENKHVIWGILHSQQTRYLGILSKIAI